LSCCDKLDCLYNPFPSAQQEKKPKHKETANRQTSKQPSRMADQAPKLNSSANVWSVQASQALTTSTELFITTTSTTTTSPAQQQREEEPQQQGDTWEDLDEPPAATTTTPLSAPLHNHPSVVDVAEHLVLIEHRRTQ